MITISRPNWIAPYHGVWKRERVRVCYVYGLHGADGSYNDEIGRPWIDASIAPLIATLNRAGFLTDFCCSGMARDHTNRNHLTGYISFKDTSIKALIGDRLPKVAYWEGQGWIIIRMKRVSDVEKRAAWKAIRKMAESV